MTPEQLARFKLAIENRPDLGHTNPALAFFDPAVVDCVSSIPETDIPVWLVTAIESFFEILPREDRRWFLEQLYKSAKLWDSLNTKKWTQAEHEFAATIALDIVNVTSDFMRKADVVSVAHRAATELRKGGLKKSTVASVTSLVGDLYVRTMFTYKHVMSMIVIGNLAYTLIHPWSAGNFIKYSNAKSIAKKMFKDIAARASQA